MHSEIVHVLHQGKIAESGTPQALLDQPNSKFADLFPELAQRMNTSALAAKEE